MTIRPLLATLLLATLCGCADPAPAPEPPTHARLRASLPALQAWVEKTRGAAIGAPASATVTDAPLPDHLRAVLPEASAARDRALFAALGFFGPRAEDRQQALAGLPPEADVTWDFAGRRLLLDPAADPSSEAFSQSAVHCLTHALQERRFQAGSWLKRLTPPGYDRRDEGIAWALLLEGEATYLGALRTQTSPGPALATLAKAHLASGRLGDLAAALGPLGGSVVADLIGRGGWAAVDKAFAQRPESTEQLLHPEKLLGKERDRPVRLKLPDVSRTLGKGWRLIAQDSLGELLLRTLFTTLTGKPQLVASAGWGGDRLCVYRHAAEVFCAFVWLTVWDTEKDATEFAQALRKAQGAARGPLREAQIRVEKTEVCVVGLRFAQIPRDAPAKVIDRVLRERRRSDTHLGVWHVPGATRAEEGTVR